MIKINGYLNYSHVNGPGKRFVIWVQGCNKLCPGCINPETHNFKGGQIVSIEELLKKIPYDVDGITVTGGEPFLQAQELFFLLFNFKMRFTSKNTVVYTGYTLDELNNMNLNYILHHIDLLIAGPFNEDDTDGAYKEWKGSNNQKLHYLSNRIKKETNNTPYEIHISKDGQKKILTGFPDKEVIKKFQLN